MTHTGNMVQTFTADIDLMMSDFKSLDKKGLQKSVITILKTIQNGQKNQLQCPQDLHKVHQKVCWFPEPLTKSFTKVQYFGPSCWPTGNMRRARFFTCLYPGKKNEISENDEAWFDWCQRMFRVWWVDDTVRQPTLDFTSRSPIRFEMHQIRV